ncbi:MAG: hypothetical protein AAB346_03395 [Pseudomonadota bacterium]
MPTHYRSGHASRRRTPAGSDRSVRQHICAEAARIMVEEGVRDYQLAKRKAIQRLNLPWDKNLPGNDEVEAALADYLRLFHGARLDADVRRLRRLALDAMQFLERFDPRLVGAVVSGTVTADAPIQLHVTVDTPEAVRLWLQEHGIPFEQGERLARFSGERQETVPQFRFTADGVTVELYVFALEDAREAPLSPVDGKPMKRANRRDVEQLLAQAASSLASE